MPPKFTFGKYIGLQIQQVAKDDPNYVVWLIEKLAMSKLKEHGVYEPVKVEYDKYSFSELEQYRKPKTFVKKGKVESDGSEDEVTEKLGKMKIKEEEKTEKKPSKTKQRISSLEKEVAELRTLIEGLLKK